MYNTFFFLALKALAEGILYLLVYVTVVPIILSVKATVTLKIQNLSL